MSNPWWRTQSAMKSSGGRCWRTRDRIHAQDLRLLQLRKFLPFCDGGGLTQSPGKHPKKGATWPARRSGARWRHQPGHTDWDVPVAGPILSLHHCHEDNLTFMFWPLDEAQWRLRFTERVTSPAWLTASSAEDTLVSTPGITAADSSPGHLVADVPILVFPSQGRPGQPSASALG